MIAILTLVLGLLVGLYVSHKCLVEPLWETESGLRKELGKVRGELWATSLEVANLELWARTDVPVFPPAIKTRTHSKVLFIPHPEDLFK